MIKFQQKQQVEENKINKSLKADKSYQFIDIIGESTTNKVKIFINIKSGKDLEDDFW